ncbi:MAG TPA: LPXTG cell wall anchor domain-containing protein [Pseudonocardiaceae bacterium]
MRTIGITALGAVAALLLIGAGPAGATDDPPVSGDDRATVHPGNIKEGDCAAAGLEGTAIEVGATIEDNTYITITSVPSGYTLTGVVVKGSDAYNVYPPTATTRLHAPVAGGSGGPAEISHWFACGTQTGTTTTPTTTTTTTTTGPTTTTGTTTSSSGTSTTTVPTSPSNGGTSAPPTTPGGSDDDLASTGASVTGYLIGGLVLLLAGGGLIYLNRRRATG